MGEDTFPAVGNRDTRLPPFGNKPPPAPMTAGGDVGEKDFDLLLEEKLTDFRGDF